jgi:hypothetical protein
MLALLAKDLQRTVYRSIPKENGVFPKSFMI